MPGPFHQLRRFLRELKRRNVYKVAVTYLAVALAGLQAVNLLIPSTTLPPWADELILAFLIVGFPVSVVVAWAFEVTPEGVRRTEADEGVRPEPSPAETETRESRWAMKALVALGLLAGAAVTGWYLTGGGGERTEISERSVAVLPFAVSGSAAETWRDGMVTVLSTGLDGAAGLRAIADRTVFAAWEREVRNPQELGRDRALGVARSIGAEYAVLGSAVAVGRELRFSAAVHGSRSGDRLGQVEVRGSPDSVPALVDELSRQVLEVLLERGDDPLPTVDVAGITTRSLPALKAYLEGERNYRNGRFEAAVEDYSRAVREDSTFALAYWRLAGSYGWQGRSERAARPRERAHDLAQRLPERERRLVRAEYLMHSGYPAAAADTLRKLTRAYPDEPHAWYLAGDASLHYAVPPGFPAADRAMGRAVALDSGFAPYHNHRVDLAVTLHRDSALFAGRFAANPTLDGSEPWIRLTFDLVSASPAAREAALRGLDTVPTWDLRRTVSPLHHPADGHVQEAVVRELAERPDAPTTMPISRILAFIVLHRRGQVEKALRLLRRSDVDRTDRACLPAYARSVGLPVDPSLRPGALDPDRLGEDSGPETVFCIGLYAATTGEERTAERAEELLRRAAEAEESAPSAPGARRAEAASGAERFLALLSGYRAWRRGEPGRALDLLPRASMGNHLRPTGLWLGDIRRELGHLEQAEEWYLGAWHLPAAHERLGRLYEEMGRAEEAASAYRRFIAAWENADELLQERVEASRQRLQQLLPAEIEAED